MFRIYFSCILIRSSRKGRLITYENGQVTIPAVKGDFKNLFEFISLSKLWLMNNPWKVSRLAILKKKSFSKEILKMHYGHPSIYSKIKIN